MPRISDDEEFFLLEEIRNERDKNQKNSSNNNSGGCFIATAAYGSYSEPHVLTLREFRDNVLCKSVFGRLFIRLYYHTTPPIARMIESREFAKKVVRAILKPLVIGVKHIFHF
jgi:hypothetical protein